MKIVKSFEESGLVIEGFKEYLPMLLGTLATNLLRRALSGEGVIRAGEGTIRAGQKL